MHRGKSTQALKYRWWLLCFLILFALYLGIISSGIFNYLVLQILMYFWNTYFLCVAVYKICSTCSVCAKYICVSSSNCVFLIVKKNVPRKQHFHWHVELHSFKPNACSGMSCCKWSRCVFSKQIQTIVLKDWKNSSASWCSNTVHYSLSILRFQECSMLYFQFQFASSFWS